MTYTAQSYNRDLRRIDAELDDLASERDSAETDEMRAAIQSVIDGLSAEAYECHGKWRRAADLGRK